MMKRILIGLGLVSGLAQGAVAQTVEERLAGAHAVYAPAVEGAPAPEQSWDADGTTVYDGKLSIPGVQKGLWEVRHGQYCSFFGPVDHRDRDWTCWNVRFPDADTVIFSAPPGPWIGPRESVGKFVDHPAVAGRAGAD